MDIASIAGGFIPGGAAVGVTAKMVIAAKYIPADKAIIGKLPDIESAAGKAAAAARERPRRRWSCRRQSCRCSEGGLSGRW